MIRRLPLPEEYEQPEGEILPADVQKELRRARLQKQWRRPLSDYGGKKPGDYDPFMGN